MILLYLAAVRSEFLKVNDLKKWGLFFLAAGVIIGCGGGGGGGGTSTTTTSTGSAVPSSVSSSLAGTTTVNFNYLTGSGRSVPGRISVTLGQSGLSNDVGTYFSAIDPNRSLLLNGYTEQNVPFTPAGVPPANSTHFDSLYLNLKELDGDPLDGGPTVTIGPDPAFFTKFYPADLRIFPGRFTNVDIFLDDSMINQSPGGNYSFNEDNFLAINTAEAQGNSTFTGTLSDYVRFDLSGGVAVPRLSDNTPSGSLFVSGDGFALGSPGSDGNLEAYTPALQITKGIFRSANLPGGTPAPGTYTLLVANPGDQNGNSTTPSRQGPYRDPGLVFSNLSTFEVFTFPNGQDTAVQTIVFVAWDANLKVSNLYYGTANLTAGTFSAYPVNQITSVNKSGVISGTLTNLFDAGKVTPIDAPSTREGTFTITGGGTPAGFKSTGRFLVFRI